MPADRKRVPKKKALVQRPPYDPEQRVVAVTGAYSFIGAELIKRLERDRRYYKVLAVDIRKPTFPMSKTQFHKIDLTMPTADADLAAIWKREGVDTVVHAAFLGTPTHANAWAHELESIGTMHVLNACAETAVRKLVVWSQTVVYGAHPLNPNFLTEEHELRGHVSRSRFVKDKVEVERQVRRFRDEHDDTIVTTLRTAATLGPHIRNFATRFFARPLAPMLMGYDPLMQLVHERDVVDAFCLAVDNDFAGEFNVVGDGVLPYSTILAMMGKVPVPMPHFVARSLSRALWATQIFDSPPNFLDFLRFLCVADGGKAKRVMGFAPVYDLKATIHDFLGVGPTMEGSGGRPQQQAATGGV
ncbi:MAG: NAD-dependent epimerase/dehydratase family protein [Myxococcales bacterium]|nr:NAD-dependent epimerase/dehydratase family protein [Myxococcales bacterium]